MEKVSVLGFSKQQNFPESFQFYFKNSNTQNIQYNQQALRTLVRPKLKIALLQKHGRQKSMVWHILYYS